jgi:hypothetical protein
MTAIRSSLRILKENVAAPKPQDVLSQLCKPVQPFNDR